jgi:hypothetical protein
MSSLDLEISVNLKVKLKVSFLFAVRRARATSTLCFLFYNPPISFQRLTKEAVYCFSSEQYRDYLLPALRASNLARPLHGMQIDSRWFIQSNRVCKQFQRRFQTRGRASGLFDNTRFTLSRIARSRAFRRRLRFRRSAVRPPVSRLYTSASIYKSAAMHLKPERRRFIVSLTDSFRCYCVTLTACGMEQARPSSGIGRSVGQRR